MRWKRRTNTGWFHFSRVTTKLLKLRGRTAVPFTECLHHAGLALCTHHFTSSILSHLVLVFQMRRPRFKGIKYLPEYTSYSIKSSPVPKFTDEETTPVRVGVRLSIRTHVSRYKEHVLANAPPAFKSSSSTWYVLGCDQCEHRKAQRLWLSVLFKTQKENIKTNFPSNPQLLTHKPASQPLSTGKLCYQFVNF